MFSITVSVKNTTSSVDVFVLECKMILIQQIVLIDVINPSSALAEFLQKVN